MSEQSVPDKARGDVPGEESGNRGTTIVVVVIVALLAGWLTVSLATRSDPEDVVEEFLTAVAERDTERALELVSPYGYGVPYGETARFLTPEAISAGWRVVSVTERGRDYSGAVVDAVLAGPDGTANGRFTVDEQDGDWLLEDPFVVVDFAASPVDYIRVNDMTAARPNDPQLGYRGYRLFPGLYRFYESVPDVATTAEPEAVLAFPDTSSSSDNAVVVPGTLTAGERAVARLQERASEFIDRCAEFATAHPYGGCPFATDGEIDTPDGKRVSELDDLEWTVKSYPVLGLRDERTKQVSGFTVRTEKPGVVTLSGRGVDTDGESTRFTVDCAIEFDLTHATVDADGEVTLRESPVGVNQFNTCHRNP